MGKILKGLTLGGIIGVVTGLLFAPQKGEETRKKLQDAVEKGKEKFKEIKDSVCCKGDGDSCCK